MLRNALHIASCLSKNQQYLLDVVKKKDIEVQQYRLDGARHWRSKAQGLCIDVSYKYPVFLSHLATVATEPFDVEAFHAQNKQLMSAVAAYEPLDKTLDDEPAATSTVKSESVGSSSYAAAKCLSPRNRFANRN